MIATLQNTFWHIILPLPTLVLVIADAFTFRFNKIDKRPGPVQINRQRVMNGKSSLNSHTT